MGDLGKGWLELCTEEDYKAAASTACDETTTPCTSRVRVDPRRSRSERQLPCGPVPKRVLSCMNCRLTLTGGRKRCISAC